MTQFMAESRLKGNKAKSVGESKATDVERVSNEFVVEDAEDSDDDGLILRI